MLIATLKPGPDVMSRAEYALARGVAAFRVNFARRAQAANVALLESVRDVAARRGVDVNLFVDLPGPKSRLGAFRNGAEVLDHNQRFALRGDAEPFGDARGVGLADRGLFERLEVGDHVAVADGVVQLVVVSRTSEGIECRVVRGGRVHTSCGVMAPSRYQANRSLTAADATVMRLVAHVATHICPSFADTVEVVRHARALREPGVRIVAKIESPVAVRGMKALAAESDGVMLARGDLRAFYSLDDMRRIARLLRHHASRHGRQLVCASNYFASMVQGGTLSSAERDELLWASALAPDFLMINETSHADCWREVLDVAVGLWNASRATVLPERRRLPALIHAAATAHPLLR